jgi:histone H3/H4
MTEPTARWRRCNNCKSDMGFEQTYWVCSVSTCNRKRTGLVFCTVSCWDAHLPLMRHREAWAEERVAPTEKTWRMEQAAAAGTGSTPRPSSRKAEPALAAAAPRRRIARPAAATSAGPADDMPREILIVVSRLKEYIRAQSGFNTAESVAGALSEHVRDLCDRAIAQARSDERRTVMDRDVPRL